MSRRYTHHPAPAYAPERDLSWHTEGGEIARIARAMDIHLMPWQRQVVDVATEYRVGVSHKTGEKVRKYHYHEVIVTVPRQSGKTTLVGPVMIHRAMTRPGSSSFFTAQTGQDAGERIRAIIDQVTSPKSKLAPIVVPTLRAGREGLKIPAARSKISRFSPTKAGLHGETPHFVGVDEFWAFSGPEGDDLVQAINPTQATIYEESQIWWFSTMGDDSSVFMNEMVDAARRNEIRGAAYFEWSIPEGMDPGAAESWWSYHPALGNTMQEKTLRNEFETMRAKDKLGEFLRAYGNRRTSTADPFISETEWESLHDPDMAQPEEFAIGYEVSGFSATVYAAWRDADGAPVTRILRQAPGTAWLPQFLDLCRRDLPVVQIAADGAGPSRRITERIRTEDEQIPRPEPLAPAIRQVQFYEFNAACSEWLEAVRDEKSLRHDGDQPLAESVAALALKHTNGVPRISRDAGHPGPAIASVLALWAWDNREAEAGPGILT